MALITNASLLAINAELERKNTLLMRFANKYARTSWLDIRNKVRGGTISENLVVGDELIVSYIYNGTEYDMPWLVVAIDREVEWEDGTKHPGLFLQSKFGTIETIQFDAPEVNIVDLTEEPNAVEGWNYWGIAGSTYTKLTLEAGDPLPTTYDAIRKCWINHIDVIRYGYNRWSHSAYRQWLNSAAGRGLWWEAQHPGDAAPSEHNTYPGFMAGLDSDFLDVLTPIKVQTACNTVTDGGVTDITLDTFFLPSIEEMYGAPQLANVEGPFFPYWQAATGFLSPSNDANDARKVYKLNAQTGSAVYSRCRSAGRGGAYGVWYSPGSGALNGSYAYAYGSYASQPVCVIS